MGSWVSRQYQHAVNVPAERPTGVQIPHCPPRYDNSGFVQPDAKTFWCGFRETQLEPGYRRIEGLATVKVRFCPGFCQITSL